MPSPFPGMEPYLEGYVWPDVHHRLATQISDQLMPLLRPRYVARTDIQVVPDETPEADIGIMYPDVEIVRARQSESALPSAALLRRGQRPLAHPRIPLSAYRITLIRATARCADIWALRLQEALPVVPVPLRQPDGDIPLDLATAFMTIYDRAPYDLSLNYAAPPPPPPLLAEEHTWVRQRIEGRVQ